MNSIEPRFIYYRYWKPCLLSTILLVLLFLTSTECHYKKTSPPYYAMPNFTIDRDQSWYGLFTNNNLDFYILVCNYLQCLLFTVLITCLCFMSYEVNAELNAMVNYINDKEQ